MGRPRLTEEQKIEAEKKREQRVEMQDLILKKYVPEKYWPVMYNRHEIKVPSTKVRGNAIQENYVEYIKVCFQCLALKRIDLPNEIIGQIVMPVPEKEHKNGTVDTRTVDTRIEKAQALLMEKDIDGPDMFCYRHSIEELIHKEWPETNLGIIELENAKNTLKQKFTEQFPTDVEDQRYQPAPQ